jgi:hypothetical protein
LQLRDIGCGLATHYFNGAAADDAAIAKVEHDAAAVSGDADIELRVR